MIVKTKCPTCQSTKDFDLDDEDYLKWQRGMTVQRAFPGLDPDDRERLITGICPECWKTLMHGVMDEDVYDQ